MTRFFSTALLTAALIGSVALIPTSLTAQERNYHDTARNDDHAWNNHEDRAYRMWAKENHRKYRSFGSLKEEDRQSYWGWRHEHDDAKLKIVIR